MQARIDHVQRVELQIMQGYAHAGCEFGCFRALELHPKAVPPLEHQQIQLRALVGCPKIGLVWLGCIDPLDGSSNIDVNVSIGTIFSIYRRADDRHGPTDVSDFMQKGTEQIAAGYVIYGSSTMLVYTTGNGVNGFTLDPSIGEFCLSHPDMKIPEDGAIYSINEGNYRHFPEGVKDFIKYCQEDDKSTNRPYSTRYIGSLVADFHRNMIKGGIYVYPSTGKAKNGKLRLLYECNPLAFIIEQAGGKASDGFNRIVEIQPESLHQRVPLFIGSANMVAKAEEFLKNRL